MKKSHRIWLAVPHEEKDEAINAHPRLDNGQNAIVWDKELRLWFARPGVELSNFKRWLPHPHDLSMNSDDPVSEFAQVLESAGLVLKGSPVMDGTLQRVPTKQDKKGSQSGVYKGFMDGRPAGWYRDYRSGDQNPTKWTFSGGDKMDPLASLHLRAHAQQTREDNARELEKQYNSKATYANRYVSSLPQATTSEYLTRKGVQAAPGVRINPKGELVIPFSNAKGDIRSYQRVPPTGGKDARILKDSEKTGNWFTFGTPVNGQPILFAEGYSTSASLHEATGLPVLMTVDAGNMIAVAQNARTVWPDSPFIFCADNDHLLKNSKTGEPENKGILSAQKAAELTNGEVIAPGFTPLELTQQLTDFNDLDVSRGREIFQHVMNVQLLSIGIETSYSNEPQIRDALSLGGFVFTPVQETTMEKEASPGTVQVSGQENTSQSAILPEVNPTSATEQGQQEAQDYARYQNKELNAATLLQKADADPDYKTGLLTTLGQGASDMTFNGQSVDPAIFAESATQGLAPEARADAEHTKKSESLISTVAETSMMAPTASEDLSAVSTHTVLASDATGAMPDPVTSSGAVPVINDEDPAPLATFDETPKAPEVMTAPLSEPSSLPAPTEHATDIDKSVPLSIVTDEQQQHATLSPDAPEIAANETAPASMASESPKLTTQEEPAEPVISPTDAEKRPVQEPRRPTTTTTETRAAGTHPQQEATTGTEPGPEVDGIVYGPRRPDAPQREDLEKIIKSLTSEALSNNKVLYRLDAQDAFHDLGNRLEMCNGASQDDRKVLAALAVASKFYGGVIELTGSAEFKEKAMRLIIDYDLDIRMKIPAQRAQFEELRKQMGAKQDAVVTHMPTPDLNRLTPLNEQEKAPQVTPSAGHVAPVTQTGTPAIPQSQIPPAPQGSSPDVPLPPPTIAEQSHPVSPSPVDTPFPGAPAMPGADTIQVSKMPEEPAPATLSPGGSVTAVLMNYGEAMYENKDQRGNSFFVELQNRGGSHTYWGQDLRKLVENHKAGDVVTLTLNSRDVWSLPNEDKERVKNNWSLVAASTGIAVSHSRPEQGQQLLSFPVDTFGKLTQQIRQAWPDYVSDLKLPPRFEDRQFYLGEDRHPIMAPQAAASSIPPSQDAPAAITPVMASVNHQTNRMDLLLVQSAGQFLQGVVRLNDTLYPALATPTGDNQQLVISAITDTGPRFAGYGQAINFEPDGTTRAAPQLMTFHLKGREEESPLPAKLYTPEKQDDALFQRLGFEQTWKQWDDARKPEDRQEKVLHQERSHSPGR